MEIQMKIGKMVSEAISAKDDVKAYVTGQDKSLKKAVIAFGKIAIICIVAVSLIKSAAGLLTTLIVCGVAYAILSAASK